jgi:hypothetical protein
MLDFYISHVYDSGIHNYYMDINTDFTGYISFIISGLIIISNILVAINANRYKKQLSPSRVNWLIFSLFTLTLTICWMLMKEISTINSFHHSFWGLLTPGFGIIGIFFGVGLEISGYILIKFKQSRIN